MDSQCRNINRRKLAGLILVLFFVCPWLNYAAAQDQEASENLVATRIASLIRETIEGSKIRLKDGSSATVMPVLPSSDALQEVKRYGDRAVKVLAAYASSSQSLEQHVSLRFLLEFHDDAALDAVQGFAGKSAFAVIRQEAVAGLTGFPSEKGKRYIEHICNTDSDPDVRAHACRAVETSDKKR